MKKIKILVKKSTRNQKPATHADHYQAACRMLGLVRETPRPEYQQYQRTR